MKFKIRTKLWIGMGLMFSMIVLLLAIGMRSIYVMTIESRTVLKNNYKSVKYSRNMMENLKDMFLYQVNYISGSVMVNDTNLYRELRTRFEENMIAEEKNITEFGEKELSNNLRLEYEKYSHLWDQLQSGKILKTSVFYMQLSPSYHQLMNYIIQVQDINMHAIERKSNQVQHTADKGYMYLSIIGTICFILAFTVSVNFPESVSKPVSELIDGIMEISKQNYDKRLLFNSNDEFSDVAVSFNDMAERLERFEVTNVLRIQSEKKKIEAIINTLSDPLIGLDGTGRVSFANKEMEQLLHVTQDDLVGKSAYRLAGEYPMLATILDEIIQNKVTSGESNNKLEIENNFYSKEILIIKDHKEQQDNFRVVGYVVIMKNVTHYLERDTAKTQLISTISHELKTPMSSIQLCVKLLEDSRVGGLNTEQSQLVKTIRQDVSRLLKISSELLDMSQVETGKMQINYTIASPINLVDEVILTFFPMAQNREITIEKSVFGQISDISMDYEKTMWVLSNLISNAIKYSENRSRILVSLRKIGDTLEFAVRDFGCGINKQYLQKIFDKFFRIPGDTREGTGLGLFISRSFIAAQNGKMWVESEIGKGSRFAFVLPA